VDRPKLTGVVAHPASRAKLAAQWTIAGMSKTRLAEWARGSAVWQADNVAVQAESQIPDLGMTVKLEWRRNANKSLPASHTIELAFRLPAEFTHGGIANVPGILMKPGETDQSVPLNALSRKIGDNLF
jgi:hypothetical protein